MHSLLILKHLLGLLLAGSPSLMQVLIDTQALRIHVSRHVALPLFSYVIIPVSQLLR